MKKKDLIRQLKKTPGNEIIVNVEGGLYLPILSVTSFDGAVVIKVKDVSRKDETVWQTSIFQK